MQNKRLQFSESYKNEALKQREYANMDVVYIFQLHADVPEKNIYTYGITYEFDKRGDAHRKRYGCEATIVHVWPAVLTRYEIRKFEVSIGQYTSRIGLRENYMKSSETFICNKNDTNSIANMIAFVNDTLPESLSVRRLEMAKIQEKKTSVHMNVQCYKCRLI